MSTQSIRDEFDESFVRWVDNSYADSQKEASVIQKVQDAYKQAMSECNDPDAYRSMGGSIQTALDEIQWNWTYTLVQSIQSFYMLTLNHDTLSESSTPDEFLEEVKKQVGTDLFEASNAQLTKATRNLIAEYCEVDEKSLMVVLDYFYSADPYSWRGMYSGPDDSPYVSTIDSMKTFENFMRRILGDPFTFGRHTTHVFTDPNLHYTRHPFEVPGSMIESFTMFKNGKAKIRFHSKDDMDEFFSALGYDYNAGVAA